MGFQASRLGNSNSRFCLLILLPSAYEVAGTYVFSRVCRSVRHFVNLGGGRGSNVTISHDALHLTIHGFMALPHSGHGTSLYRNHPVWPPPLDMGPHCRGPSLALWPLLLISVHLGTLPPNGADIWWLLKHIPIGMLTCLIYIELFIKITSLHQLSLLAIDCISYSRQSSTGFG